MFYLLPVQGNLVIARQHGIINISSAEECSEMQPKIFVWSCLHGLLFLHSLRGAAASQTSSGSHTEKGWPGSCRTEMWDSQPASCLDQVPSSFSRLPFSWSSWRKLLHPTPSSLQGFGLNTVPRKQVLKIFRRFCTFLCMVGRNGMRRQRMGACRWTPCSWPHWRCTWHLPIKQNTNPNQISLCHGHAHHICRTSRAL